MGDNLQNMMHTFSEALYFLHVEVMANLYHYYNISPVTTFIFIKIIYFGYKRCNHSILKPCRRRHDLPNIQITIGYD